MDIAVEVDIVVVEEAFDHKVVEVAFDLHIVVEGGIAVGYLFGPWLGTYLH